MGSRGQSSRIERSINRKSDILIEFKALASRLENNLNSPLLMNNKQKRRRIEGLKKQIEKHIKKIENTNNSEYDEIEKERQNHHHETELNNYKKEIERIEKQLNKKRRRKRLYNGKQTSATI